MRASRTGRGVRIGALSALVVAGAVAALAKVAPIDFTGHWTGTATGTSPVTLIADLTSSGKTVTGTVTSTQDGQITQCTLHGKQRGRSHIKASLTPCKTVLQGKFDAASDSITGHYVRHGRHKTQTGTFTIARVSSPSGAFLDERDVL